MQLVERLARVQLVMTRHSELAGGQNKVAALKSVEIVHVLLCPCPGFLAPSDDVGRRTITLLEG
jgi:hypothetical protein